MSDATDRPAGPDAARAGTGPAGSPDPDPDPDAWARACREDLAAEQARRREQYGPETGNAAEELRRLVDAVADKVTSLGAPLAGAAAQGAAQQVAQQLLTQAKAAAQPVIERNPQFFGHLAAAGQELLAAYRAAVVGQESHWTRTSAQPEAGGGATTAETTKGHGGDDGPSGSERIDLD